MKKLLLVFTAILTIISCKPNREEKSTDEKAAPVAQTLNTPVKITGTSQADVLIYKQDSQEGSTLVELDKLEPVSFISTSGEDFSFTGITNIRINEALDSSGNIVASMSHTSKLKETALTKYTALVKEGGADFFAVLGTINPEDYTAKTEGDTTPPDPSSYTTLRNVYFYNFNVQDSQGNITPLQVYIEMIKENS